MMTSNERYLRNVTAVSAVAGVVLSFALIPVLELSVPLVPPCSHCWCTTSMVWLILFWRLGVNVFKPDFGFALKYVRPARPL